MEIMFLLIGLSLLMAAGFLAAFFWAMRDGQFDDTETPALRMLFDDNPVLIKPASPHDGATEMDTKTSPLSEGMENKSGAGPQ